MERANNGETVEPRWRRALKWQATTSRQVLVFSLTFGLVLFAIWAAFGHWAWGLAMLAIITPGSWWAGTSRLSTTLDRRAEADWADARARQTPQSGARP